MQYAEGVDYLFVNGTLGDRRWRRSWTSRPGGCFEERRIVVKQGVPRSVTAGRWHSRGGRWPWTGSAAEAAPTGDAGPFHPGVDAVFADLDRDDAPGAAVGVLLDGEVVHRAGYGIAHMDFGIPITPQTVFDIASISKQFGAMAALLLEGEGRLDLDADVREDYVPEVSRLRSDHHAAPPRAPHERDP